jgi:hypothetical protein
MDCLHEYTQSEDAIITGARGGIVRLHFSHDMQNTAPITGLVQFSLVHADTQICSACNKAVVRLVLRQKNWGLNLPYHIAGV